MSNNKEPENPFLHPWCAPIEADTKEASNSTDSTSDDLFPLQEASSHTKTYATNYYYGLPAPNDTLETPRLNHQHELFKLTAHGALYRAPLNGGSVRRVLDTCTGTGVWARDMAQQFPSAQIVGVDLTAVDATGAPANVSFAVKNIEQDWGFAPSERFDFIHGRMIVVAVTDWPAYLRRAYEALNPGGWLEIQDLSFPLGCSDGSAGPDSPLMQWGKYMVDANKVLGRCYGEQYQEFDKQFADAGFVNFRQELFTWPLNTWPKDPHEKRKGALSYKNMMDGIEGFTSMSFKRALNWSQERVDELVKGSKADLGNTALHTYIPIKFMYAQKSE